MLVFQLDHCRKTIHRTEALRLPLILAALLALSGCGSYECGRARIPLPEVGQARADVVETFGEPGASEGTTGSRIDVYEFQYESCGGVIFPVPYIGVLPLWGGSDAFWTVEYESNQRVIAVQAWPGVEDLEEVFTSATERRDQRRKRRSELFAAADHGDVGSAIIVAGEFADQSPLVRLAQSGDVAAAEALASRYGHTHWLERLARDGDLDAAGSLARITGDVAPLRQSADSGNVTAAILLAEITGDTSVLQEHANNQELEAVDAMTQLTGDLTHLEELAAQNNGAAEALLLSHRAGIRKIERLLATDGYDRAAEWAVSHRVVPYHSELIASRIGPDEAYKVYVGIIRRMDESDAEIGVMWICAAADLGHPRAREDLGYSYRPGLHETYVPWKIRWMRAGGLSPSRELSYIWYTLAARAGHPTAMQTREYVAERMPSTEVQAAERGLLDWRPGQCPRPPE